MSNKIIHLSKEREDKKASAKLFYLDNKALLSQHKIGFLCSRKIPAHRILKTYD